MVTIEKRYTDGSYLTANPEWDRQDSEWKAKLVLGILARNGIAPSSICEVGCGAGDILLHVARALPKAALAGFDVSPQAVGFWNAHRTAGSTIDFRLGDFHAVNEVTFDVLLMLDVFEHVRDALTFLEQARRHARHFVFHIPLDLSASSVARGAPLMRVREKVGHLQFYTKDIALATLRESGYEIISWKYTGASLEAPNRSRKTRLASLARRLVYSFNKDFGVRLLGGETLLVLAK